MCHFDLQFFASALLSIFMEDTIYSFGQHANEGGSSFLVLKPEVRAWHKLSVCPTCHQVFHFDIPHHV